MKRRFKLISDGTLDGSRLLLGEEDISDLVASVTLCITPDGVTAKVELIGLHVEADVDADVVKV